MEVKMLRVSILLFVVLIICVAAVRPAEADGAVELVVGASAFLDEDIPFDHFMVGASYEFELTEKLSFKPQFMMMFGPGNDRDYAIMGNIAYDLVRRQNIELYVVGGAGLVHHTDQFGTGPAFSADEAIINGGIGVKIHVSKRLYISPEFRIGLEPFYLATVNIGYSF
jgi:hypothetical protein